MARIVGVWAGETIAVGLVEDRHLTAPLRNVPDQPAERDALHGMPSEHIVSLICDAVEQIHRAQAIDAVGVGFPGMIVDGVVEESPNLQQMKGCRLRATMAADLGRRGIGATVEVINNADAVAAGVAATEGHLDRMIRVWTLGDGIGFGRYPRAEAPWEGGHAVVTLDPRERYCGCGGEGHLEGIMGNRAMRLRFLDMEPEEIFENARKGDARCTEFVRMWHRALAAATATSIHMDGGGKFFIGGANARFLDLALLRAYVQDMVKMSSLQRYAIEVFASSDEIGVIGAAVDAER
jgi:predicted NBD/HSP70 family sugar kinase